MHLKQLLLQVNCHRHEDTGSLERMFGHFVLAQAAFEILVQQVTLSLASFFRFFFASPLLLLCTTFP